MKSIRVFAPATVANLACGFDVLGLALDGLGDIVEIKTLAEDVVRVSSISGDGGKLPLAADRNTAAVAVNEFRKLCGCKTGFEIRVEKGLPLGSGLGSSAASGVAALLGANYLSGEKFSRQDLIGCAMEAERVACGSAHADNVAPALLGGIVLIRSYDPLDVISLDYPQELGCVVVTPKMELNTMDARRVLRKQVRLSDAIRQWGNLAGLVAGLLKKDMALISRSLVDDLIEPERAILIPGFYMVKNAAISAGALGCSISGSGPSVFAIVSGEETGSAVSQAMQNQFSQIGLECSAIFSRINSVGGRILN